MSGLQVIVKTPHEDVLRTTASSMRVLTESGQVGLRPRMEPVVLAVEPGLALIHQPQGTLYLGTAGGLLDCDGTRVRLLTPRAVVGRDEQEVVRQLSAQLGQPTAEMEVRHTINRIQTNILEELKRDRQSRRAGKEVSGG